MRILFTITGPWGTGAATVVDGVAKELLRLGHEVKILFPDLGLPSLDAERYYGNASLYHIIKFPLKALKSRAYETALTYSWRNSTLQRLAYYERAIERAAQRGRRKRN